MGCPCPRYHKRIDRLSVGRGSLIPDHQARSPRPGMGLVLFIVVGASNMRSTLLAAQSDSVGVERSMAVAGGSCSGSVNY